MAAIPITALHGNLVEPVEYGTETSVDVPELQFSHAWRIDHQPAGAQHKHLPRRSTVPPAIIVLANWQSGLGCVTEQAIDDRRLTNS